MRRKPVKAQLRDTPLSDYELSRYRYYVESRKVPPLPAWAKSPSLPRPVMFVPGQPAIVPAWTRSTTPAPAVIKIPTLQLDGEPLSAAEYVREFDRLNGLKPLPVTWIKPTLGSYA